MISVICAAAICQFNQTPDLKLEVGIFPFSEPKAYPVELFEGEKIGKSGKLNVATIAEFGTKLNEKSGLTSILHIESEAWTNTNFYMEKAFATSETEYSKLAVISKPILKDTFFEWSVNVSDGQLKSNLTFTGGKFDYKDKLKIAAGEVLYRFPSRKLNNERVMLVFALSNIKRR